MGNTSYFRNLIEIPATELRDGDLLSVGGSNYVLVHSITITDEAVKVRIYNGTEPTTEQPFSHPKNEPVFLSRRDAKP